ncbi:hypothetical protein M378DRAFT_173688 [Amanita muscaria Koide BX008]|uniref:Uncharacterized protein n=1 Tax=Amanita muscaria (strain Koide BX008) TaxID=946122 RepID=A0A0C2RYC2_AMAMK|nr:hypothetical protein M378DRAFT_173688 [Amanita muscaria Koide BX008]
MYFPDIADAGYKHLSCPVPSQNPGIERVTKHFEPLVKERVEQGGATREGRPNDVVSWT